MMMNLCITSFHPTYWKHNLYIFGGSQLTIAQHNRPLAIEPSNMKYNMKTVSKKRLLPSSYITIVQVQTRRARRSTQHKGLRVQVARSSFSEIGGLWYLAYIAATVLNFYLHLSCTSTDNYRSSHPRIQNYGGNDICYNATLSILLLSEQNSLITQTLVYDANLG